MTLLSINEPQLSKAQGVAVGIDLGTTHSLLAWMDQDAPKTLDISGNPIVPSAVYVDAAAKTYIGHAALMQAAIDDNAAIRSFKRLFGKRSLDAIVYPHPLSIENGQLVIHLGNSTHAPRTLASYLLHYLTNQFEQQTQQAIVLLVVTVPAYFDDVQRADVLAAARAIGFSHAVLLSEPTAAALAYRLHENTQGCVMVYDFGGGTFDVSILTMQDDLFTVHAVGGDTELGGDDCDRCIAKYFANHNYDAFDKLPHDKQRVYLRAARYCKEYLSNTASQTVNVDVNGVHLTLDMATMERLLAPLVMRTINLCKATLRDAEHTISAMSAIVLVGGSSRLPFIAEKLEAVFGIQPLMDIDPDQVVALGAAIHAHELYTQEQGVLLLDVTPLSLGLETMGGLMEVVIPRNSTIPISKRQEFTTHTSGQTAMTISVYQGERSHVADNRFLDRFVLRDIPPLAAGVARIAVDFSLDANGVLTVSAQEMTQGKKIVTSMQPSNNISVAEITKMLVDSEANFADDIAQRMLTEASFDAQQILDMMQKALTEDSDLLLAQEADIIRQRVEQLTQLIEQQKSADAIRTGTQALDRCAGRFMQARMDRALAQSIAGTSVDDYSK